MPYGVRMRNSTDDGRGTWAAYAKEARTGAVPAVSMSELARRVRVDRTTVYRWETGAQRPDDPDLVVRFANALNLDHDEALAAAGLRPGAAAPAEPTREYDEEVDLVLSDDRLSKELKGRIIKLIHERREREKAAGLAQTREMLSIAHGEAS